jgi:hypothetical protein
MSRRARIFLSLGLTLIGSAAALFMMFGTKGWSLRNWNEYLACVLIGLILLIPAWLCLLPMVLINTPMTFVRRLFFILIGTLAAPTALVWETIFFFNHARANAFPAHPWFVHEAVLTAVCSAVLCIVYLLIVGSAHAGFSSNMQSAR